MKIVEMTIATRSPVDCVNTKNDKSILFRLCDHSYLTHQNVDIFHFSLFCISSLGMSIVASKYPDDRARSGAMGVAMGGAALGVLGKRV